MFSINAYGCVCHLSGRAMVPNFFFHCCSVTVLKYGDLSKGPKCKYAGKEKLV